jgi:2,5-dioxopentanoate dehydrogenase
MTPFQALNPTTGDPLPETFAVAQPMDVDKAAREALQAFAEYGRWSGARRASLLRAVAERLEASETDLVARAHLETALPQARLRAELARTCFQLRSYGAAAAEGSWVDARIDPGGPLRQPTSKPDLRSLLRPLGPVVVFGASNFPFAYSTAGGDTASALAAGCPVIVKAHPAHPGTASRAAECIHAALREVGAPPGVFCQLFDSGYAVGAALVAHPLVRAVGFTGSQRGGRALMDLAAARPEPIPVFAEMGSVNPVVILPGAAAARGEEIARGLHASFTLGVGQFCTNPGLVFLPLGAEDFLAMLATLTAATPAGVMLTGGILDHFGQSMSTMLEQDGVRLLARGPAGDLGTARATVLIASAATFARNPRLMEECFGPSTLVITYENLDQLCATLGTLEGQLTATLHGNAEDPDAERVLQILEARAGRIIFNGFPTGVEVCESQVHGGPYPATSAPHTTAVGTRALSRFTRLLAFQNAPQSALPPELRDGNPLGILRRVDGRWTRE